jgi:hypothetical protein
MKKMLLRLLMAAVCASPFARADSPYLIINPSSGAYVLGEGYSLTITTDIGVTISNGVPGVPLDYYQVDHFNVSGSATHGVDYTVTARLSPHAPNAYGYGLVPVTNGRFQHYTYRHLGPNFITINLLNNTILDGTRTLFITRSSKAPGPEPSTNIEIRIRDDDLLPSSSAYISNLSTRGVVGSGEQTMIAGFVQSTSQSNTILIRGLGPTLAFYGVAGAISNPAIALYSGSGSLIASNDDWQSAPNADVVQGTGLAPAHAAESVILTNLNAHSYTAHLTKSGTGSIGLFEVYDRTTGTGNTLKNISTRAYVGSGESVLIAGFVITGGPRRVLITGKGPSLAQYGIQSFISNPELILYNSNNVVVETNQFWNQAWNASVIANQANRPNHNSEAAIFEVLPAGAYTVVLRGAYSMSGSTTGIGLVEIFDQ